MEKTQRLELTSELQFGAQENQSYGHTDTTQEILHEVAESGHTATDRSVLSIHRRAAANHVEDMESP